MKKLFLIVLILINAVASISSLHCWDEKSSKPSYPLLKDPAQVKVIFPTQMYATEMTEKEKKEAIVFHARFGIEGIQNWAHKSFLNITNNMDQFIVLSSNDKEFQHQLYSWFTYTIMLYGCVCYDPAKVLLLCEHVLLWFEIHGNDDSLWQKRKSMVEDSYKEAQEALAALEEQRKKVAEQKKLPENSTQQ